MPDFEAKIHSGVILQDWNDPADGDSPGRVNPRASHAEKRWVGEVGTQVEVRATVGGTPVPLDSALDGRLFVGFLVEAPYPRPAVTTAASQSSIQRFTPNQPGHYTFRMRRPGGGAWIFHIDAVAP